MDEQTRREIEKVAWTTLKEAGIVRPPADIQVVLDHLRLNREFYDLKNPGFLDRTKHKLRINGQKLIKVVQKSGWLQYCFMMRSGSLSMPANRY